MSKAQIAFQWVHNTPLWFAYMRYGNISVIFFLYYSLVLSVEVLIFREGTLREQAV